MNLANVVFEISEKFMSDSRYVSVNYDNIDKFVSEVEDTTPPKFPQKKGQVDIFKACLLELIGNSINYCYWYGRSNIRPLECSSSKMYEILEKAFEKYNKTGGLYSINNCLDEAICYLSVERFPLIEERIKHLNELRPNIERFIRILTSPGINVNGNIPEYDLNHYLMNMVQIFPGFASDMFLKRAFLFFAQLYRKFGWFEKDMMNAPIPADYQVPKMLESYGLITYSKELTSMINSEIQIPKGSLLECEIRSASIIACRNIGQKLNWAMPDVDAYFWLKRKQVTTPFHLTVTTDY